MTHYGITGFGTAAALATALGLDDEAEQISNAVAEMYDTDELLSEVAEAAVNLDAAEQ